MTAPQYQNAPSFHAAGPVYAFAPDAKPVDLADQLSARLGQLTAMLNLIIGEGLGRFNGMATQLQDDYLWNCAMLAEECNDLSKALHP